jgi:aconitase B
MPKSFDLRPKIRALEKEASTVIALDQLHSILNLFIAARDQYCLVLQRRVTERKKLAKDLAAGAVFEPSQPGSDQVSGLTIAEHGVTSLQATGVPASMTEVHQALRQVFG